MKNRRLVVTLVTILIFTLGAIILVNNQIKTNSKINFNPDMETIQLQTPVIDTQNELIVALKNRQTQRNISEEKLSPEILSEVLWAANGKNRTTGGHNGNGGYTAPLLWDVNIHVAMESGVYKYNPDENTLTKTLNEDIRNKMTYQDFAHKAPAILILSLDTADMTESYVEATGGKEFYAGSMVSYISQNVYLYCASKKLSTVAMAWIDNNYINSKLALEGSEHSYLVQPIGYPEKQVEVEETE